MSKPKKLEAVPEPPPIIESVSLALYDMLLPRPLIMDRWLFELAFALIFENDDLVAELGRDMGLAARWTDRLFGLVVSDEAFRRRLAGVVHDQLQAWHEVGYDLDLDFDGDE